VSVPDGLAQIRSTFWNPERSPTVTCATCTAPVDGYAVCFQCRTQYETSVQLADNVVPISYAVKGSQAMSDLYQYKDLRASHDHRVRAQDRIFGAFYASMSDHLACIAGLSARPIIVATVPSTGGRTTAHPLDEVRRMFGGWDQALLTFMGPHALSRDQRRQLQPSWFQVQGEVRGRHVLLIDDTWVSGVHVQSCAGALKQAGATNVTAVTFGRYLDPAFPPPRNYLASHRLRTFDPEICPLTGTAH